MKIYFEKDEKCIIDDLIKSVCEEIETKDISEEVWKVDERFKKITNIEEYEDGVEITINPDFLTDVLKENKSLIGICMPLFKSVYKAFHRYFENIENVFKKYMVKKNSDDTYTE